MKDIQVYSTLLNRALLFAKLGSQYGTSRDIYQALGYPKELTYENFLAEYSRHDIAAAIINRPVNDTWRGGFQVMETKDDKDTVFEKAWEDLSKRLSLPSKFARLDRLTGLGEYGVLLLGFDDSKTVDDFAKPLSTGKRMLIYVKPFGQGSAVIADYEQETTNERFGLPTFYDITITNPGKNTSSLLKVHYSRVLHITEGLLESEVEGTPRLKPVYNRLFDLDKLVGGSAEMFWRGARPGYQGKVDPEFQMTAETKADLKDQIDEFEHNLRRIIVNEGVDLKELAQQIADPGAYVDVQIQMISAVTGIPKRILTGSERGELSSTQDRDTWLSLITGRREEFAESSIICPFVEYCILYGALPKPGEDYSIIWPSLFEETDKDKVDVGKVRAGALKEYTSSPTSQMVVPPEAFFRFFLGFDEDQIELITEMQEAFMDEYDESLLNPANTPTPPAPEVIIKDPNEPEVKPGAEEKAKPGPGAVKKPIK